MDTGSASSTRDRTARPRNAALKSRGGDKASAGPMAIPACARPFRRTAFTGYLRRTTPCCPTMESPGSKTIRASPMVSATLLTSSAIPFAEATPPCSRLPPFPVDGWEPGPKAKTYIRRLVSQSVSTDFVHWERPWRVVVPEARDSGTLEFYGVGGVFRAGWTAHRIRAHASRRLAGRAGRPHRRHWLDHPGDQPRWPPLGTPHGCLFRPQSRTGRLGSRHDLV